LIYTKTQTELITAGEKKEIAQIRSDIQFREMARNAYLEIVGIGEDIDEADNAIDEYLDMIGEN